jgi:hypothetical protein
VKLGCREVNCKLYYELMRLKCLCNLAGYCLQALRGWHDNVETFTSVIICEIIVHLLVRVQNNTLHMFIVHKYDNPVAEGRCTMSLA